MTLKILSGRFKGRNLKTPSGTKTRPTQGVVRAALFNRCQNELEGARFLDLFAGSGAMGLEALSRGAAEVLFVERDRDAARCIQDNLALLKVEATVLTLDALAALKAIARRGSTFTLLYIDPPYDQPAAYYDELFALLKPLLAPGARVFLEERNTTPITPSGWTILDRRRFGITSLTEYLCQSG